MILKLHMKDRPRIKIPLSSIDKIIETAAILCLIGLWSNTIFSYSTLPDTIPIHFNGLGEVDRTSGKISFFLLPILATLVFLLLTFINNRPHTFKYPIEITEENALAFYTLNTRVLRWIKFLIMLIFAGISFIITFISYGNIGELGIWFLPTILIVILSPILYLGYKNKQLKKQQ